MISTERLQMLPENGELQDIHTIVCNDNDHNDLSPAPDQIDPGNINDGNTNSGILLNDQPHDIRQEVENIVSDVVGESHGDVTINRRRNITIPWPTRDDVPLSEFTT